MYDRGRQWRSLVTKLEIRRVPFDFADDVPFGWHPDNPEFACMMNMVSVMAIAFEKYVVRVVRGARPLISDPAVAQEADGFLRQEAQHAGAHQQHLRALIRTHPGLQGVLDGAVAAYDELFDARPRAFHLAYIADLEATFTPTFKMLLDHEDDLFRPGDERVASLFLWHFVEEIEHRSSALVICDHLVANKWYRLKVLPSVLRHMHHVSSMICEGFNEHVPIDIRRVDARGFLPALALRRQVGQQIPGLARVARDIDTRYPMALWCVPAKEQRQAYRRILASQTPSHDPQRQPLPPFADAWFARFEQGEDISHWYSSQLAG
jgi:predicted metal-dependent hydrolase